MGQGRGGHHGVEAGSSQAQAGGQGGDGLEGQVVLVTLVSRLVVAGQTQASQLAELLATNLVVGLQAHQGAREPGQSVGLQGEEVGSVGLGVHPLSLCITDASIASSHTTPARLGQLPGIYDCCPEPPLTLGRLSLSLGQFGLQIIPAEYFLFC